MFSKRKLAMILAEFVGTFVLASVILSTINYRLFPIFVGLAASIAFVGMRLSIGHASNGGYYNPALVIADWTARRLETGQALVMVAVQMLAGLIAWNLNEYLLGSPIELFTDLELKWPVFVAEAMGAFVLALIFSAAAKLGSVSKFMSDTTASVALALGMLVAAIASNGFINPAVALGVQSWSFAYVAAPILGTVIGVNLYWGLFDNLDDKKPKKAVAVVKKKTIKKKATQKKKK